MTVTGSIAILLLAVVTILLALPTGRYLHAVFSDGRPPLDGAFLTVEKVIYALMGVDPSREMDWKQYAKNFLMLNFVMLIVGYIILRIMGLLPLNPNHIPSMNWDLAFNTAISFVTNTNWQNYAVSGLSPVHMTVRIPIRRSSSKRSRMPGFTMSFR